jgi:alpha-tubulin suppressor-like RCC1 family protein
VKTNGSIACWGNNANGEATPPSGSFTSVSAGYLHTCGVKTDGSIACWGDNYYGQATPPAI